MRFAAIGLLFLSLSNAHAVLPMGARSPELLFTAPKYSFTNNYQIGSEWGKRVVTAQEMQKNGDVYRRTALATAKTGGGTGFYLGKFNGFHVMATNHHVFEKPENCLGLTVKFTEMKQVFECTTFFGSWSDVDLALFAIQVNTPEQENALAAVAGGFAFHDDIYPGQPLITIGHGVAENPTRKLVANYDSDCKVFSEKNDFHFMGDPDDYNPAPYKAWSFSNGCDVSHGDSGSAMVDRNTGKVVGIIWTGRIPKKAEVQNSDYLNQMLQKKSSEIWTELSYAVPAPKIGEFLTLVSQDQNEKPETRQMLIEMLK